MTSTASESSLIKRKKLKSGSHVPRIDTSQARSNLEVLRMCIEKLGWKECISASSIDSDIYWHSATFQEGNRNYTSNSARVNKFPGMCDLMRKVNLTRSLNVMRTLFPDEFDFYPRTWFLPEQIDQFKADVQLIHQKDRKRRRPLTTFIVKPSDGSEGAGIYLIQDPTRCYAVNRPHIVQKYIDRPVLINGLKFDIRIYVLILQLDPLEIFLYDEGLARFATVYYQSPSATNLHETFMHLTNYSLNKRSIDYKHALDSQRQTDASKRKLSLVWSQLLQLFSPNEINQAKEMIKDIINKTVLAILPELRVQYAMELPITQKQNRCFQIIGFDIILTDQLKPILLEVNANPSLRIDFDHVNETGKTIHEPSPIDEEIKRPLVLETLKLIIQYKRHRQAELSHQIDTKTSLDSTSEKESDREQQYQPSSASNVIKSLNVIYSSTSQNKYEHIFLLEKIAFIYIQLVIKRGYKAMNNWPFRNFAKICGIIDQSTTMSSIDMLYTQIFYKCKEYGSQSPATGLNFPAFVEGFLLLARRKYPTSSTLFDSVSQLINSCMNHLNLDFDRSS